MSLNITIKDLINKKLTDFRLVLIDDENRRTELNLHKCILYFKCDFFRAMFDFDPKLESQIVTVSNAYIARDIILEFYGIIDKIEQYPDWYLILEEMKIRKFFCLNFEAKRLYELQIPEQYYDLLFDILKFYDPLADNNLMKMFRRNLSSTTKIKLGSESDNNILPKIFLMELLRDIMLIASSNNKNIQIWDFETEEHIITLDRKNDQIIFSHDNKKIIYKENLPYINLIDIDTGKNLQNIFYFPFSTYGSISKNNQYIAEINNNFVNDYCINIWDVETRTKIKKLSGHSSYINSIVFSNDNKYIASGGADERVRIWNIDTGECKILGKHWHSVSKVIFSNDDKYVYSASYDQSIMVWDVENNTYIRTIYDTSSIHDVKLSNDNKYIIYINKNYLIKLYDTQIDEFVTNFSYQNTMQKLNNVVFSHDSKSIILGDKNGVRVWDINLGKYTRTITKYPSVNLLAMSN